MARYRFSVLTNEIFESSLPFPSLPLARRNDPDDVLFLLSSTLRRVPRPRKRFHLGIFLPPLPSLLFSTPSIIALIPLQTPPTVSLNDRCNRVAMYLSCYESEREFRRSEIESKFSRTANKVCESMRTERYTPVEGREEQGWNEKER